ncbi:MAG: hypothetical protein JWM44_728 [Bacilli bacterium]|nr:hypothetical protein [Bacilli bacterium]
MKNPIINHGSPNHKQIAFTFDDGPIHLDIEAWLHVLELNGAIGTFFFTGEWIDRFPQKARAIIARGHELAPHTYHHRRMSEVSREVFFEEIKLTELAFQEATGLACPAFLRFPYGGYTEENLNWLAEWGYIDIEGESTGDWEGISAAETIVNTEPHLYEGSILVFHCNDIAKETPNALKPLIAAAFEKGLKPVTVSALLKSIGSIQKYRSWKICIDVPLNYTLSEDDWVPILSSTEQEKLASESFEWGISQKASGFAAKEEWFNYITETLEANGIRENKSLFGARYFKDQFWAYARAGVKGEELVLLDFATREAHGDALVNVLQWAMQKAIRLGCRRVVAKRDMRRLQRMCQQLGWASHIVIEEQPN